MKKNFFIACFILIPSLMFSQVKNYVGVVRQQYYPEYIEQINEYSENLKTKGFNTYSKILDSYIKSGFGSGFIYVADNGDNFVITNRHVVSQAETASIEIENNSTGKIDKYENLTVVLTDDEIDIAILAFPKGVNPFSNGLTFDTSKLIDGEEVWSAGYPGLGNEPMWQFAKGVVTNSSAKINDLLDSNISSLIQHSAQIDSGNSGGPLLIKSSNKIGYSVVGINTWKAFYRDSTNFAIPSSVIKSMIERINQEVDDDKEIKEKVEKFVEKISLKDEVDYTSIVNFISYKKAAIDGQKDFEFVLNYGTNSIKDEVASVFSSNPAEGMRYSCAYSIWDEFKTEDFEELEIAEIKKDGDFYNVLIKAQGDNKESNYETVWVKEHGLWRLNSEDSYVKKEKKTESSKQSNPVYFRGVGSVDTLNLNVGMSLDYICDYKNFDMSVGFYSFREGRLGLGAQLSINNFSDAKFISAMSFLEYRLPFDFNKFVITPYCKAGLGISRPLSFSQAYYGNIEVGGKLIFDIGLRTSPGVGFAYSSSMVDTLLDEEESKVKVIGKYSIYAVFAF